MVSFKERVLAIVRGIPKGKVSTYGKVARAAGKPRAARAVGNILRTNPCAEKVPCYRVVRSDGKVGGYVFGVKEKIRRLRSDGFVVKNGKIDVERKDFW